MSAFVRRLCAWERPLRSRITWVAATSAVVWLPIATAASAAAAVLDHQVAFSIPAQPLDGALLEFARQADVQLAVTAPSLDRIQAPELNGTLPANVALDRLLSKTGLAYRTVGSTITVTAAAKRSAGDQQSLRIAAAKSPNEVDAAESRGSSLDNSTNEKRSGKEKAKADVLEEVVITGSHIRGIEDRTNPMIVIDRAQIARSGYSSTQDLFRSLSQNFSSGNATEDGIFSGNPNAGVNSAYASGINLRGLGVSSTLVLLNGHRIAPSASGTVVDVSLIPLSAIDRVEILTDGSSAIYGSDAVGGVVNIILKKDYQGADTSARYGSVTDGSRHEILIAQTLGRTWDEGNAVGALQYQSQSALPARDREFTSALTSPNDLLPDTRSYAATVNGHQNIADILQFTGDALFSKREFARGTSYSGPAQLGGMYRSDTGGDTRIVNISSSLRYDFASRWSLDLNGLYGRQKATFTTVAGYVSRAPVDVSAYNQFTEKSIELIANGHLGTTPAGDIGLAFGISYRDEDMNSLTVVTPGRSIPINEERHVSAGFAELYVPVVAKENRMALVQALEFSAAVRRDQYSDFGSTTNPRLGLRWSPWKDVSIKASYGKSFRAPNAVEGYQTTPSYQTVFAYPPIFASPTGGRASAIVLGGSKSLTAERARTEDFGIDYTPSAIEGLKVGIGYYDIRYEDRIVTPSHNSNALIKPNVYGPLIASIANDAAAQAIVDATVAAGGQYYNPYGSGIAGIRYLLDLRQQNAAVVNQTGFDLSSEYAHRFPFHSLTLQLNVSFTDKIDTALVQGTEFSNLVNTFGNPPKWRARFDGAWASSRWSVSAALNAVGSYVNTATVGNPQIGSWTTLDVNATINADGYIRSAAWTGVSLSIIALNALNRDPPYVGAPTLIRVNYDASNANPLGRFVALNLKKKW